MLGLGSPGSEAQGETVMSETTRAATAAEELSASYLAGGGKADLLTSDCHGGGGSTTGSAPGCADIADPDDVGSEDA